MTNTNFRTFLYILPLLVMACSLTAQSAAVMASPMPEQTATAKPAQISAPSLTPAPKMCQVKTGLDAGALNLRACGGTDCPVLTVLREGETLTQTKAQPVNDWLEVQTANGLTGWVNSNYLDCEVTHE